MDLSIPKHFTTGILNGDDLKFFYYDICLDTLQGWPLVYDWDSVVEEFKGQIDIDSCQSAQIPENFEQNKIRFTVSEEKAVDNVSKSAAFFRHLRNAFAHYYVVRKGKNYVLTDGRENITMRGLVDAELLKQFCFRFFDLREKTISDHENTTKSIIDK